MKSIITRPGSPPPAIFISTDRDWIKTMVLLLGLELSFGTQSIRDELRHLPKRAFKTHSNDIFSLLGAEDNYVELPILLQKIANYRANTKFNL